jgi:cytidylate kinase
MIIAIDGPAGAGKSSTAKALAKELGFTYLDTGAMYRAVAYKVSKIGIPLDDVKMIMEILKNTKIELIPTENGVKVLLDGEDVSDKIRNEKIGRITSKIASYSEVRKFMVKLQRELGKKYGNIVIEGRDTGTVIFPEAEVKIFMTASPEIRAKRRYEELKSKGLNVNYEEILKIINERDKQDSTRKDAPLKPAPDSIIIDTTNLSPSEVLEKIKEIVLSKSRL